MRSRRFIPAAALLLALLVAQLGWSFYQKVAVSQQMTHSARAWLGMLSAEHKSKAMYPLDSPQRMGWHFIPKDSRKGLELNDMNDDQRRAAHALLKSALSDAGYDKARQIMRLESLLKELEASRNGGPIRDSLRYYFTIFGDPAQDGRWGLSVEGHHLSLNFLVEDDKVISSTPQFFASNPAIVKSENQSGLGLGTRVLRKEETLAFELVNSLSKQQREIAILADKAPREIRAAGEPQPPRTAPEGIGWKHLSAVQRTLLRQLINEYLNAMPEEVVEARRAAIRDGKFGKIHFAWAGAMNPGVGHYYRVQGPTFLIEFVNTQPDSDGNPANHIHCVWRDMHGDFGVSLAAN